MLVSKQPRLQYSEIEAADMLGLTVDQLRTLVKNHIVKDDSEGAPITISSFQPSDLVVLRILARNSQETVL